MSIAVSLWQHLTAPLHQPLCQSPIISTYLTLSLVSCTHFLSNVRHFDQSPTMRHRTYYFVTNGNVHCWTLTVLILSLVLPLVTSSNGTDSITLPTSQEPSSTSQATTSTIPDNTPKLTPCDIKANCSNNEICLNRQCTCKASYTWNLKGECEEINCDKHLNVCEKHDPNRRCVSTFAFVGYSECQCRTGYYEDPNTFVCRPSCSTDRRICPTVDGPNTSCNVYLCRCRTGYRRTHTGQCEPFRCSIDAHCQTEGDHYRTCDNGTCTCPYEIDPITDQCTFKVISLFKLRYYHSWQAEKILLATVIIVPIVFYYCVLQNYRKARSTLVSIKGPGAFGLDKLQPPTINSIADYKQQVYSDQIEPIGQLSKARSYNPSRPKQTKDQFKYQRFV